MINVLHRPLIIKCVVFFHPVLFGFEVDYYMKPLQLLPLLPLVPLLDLLLRLLILHLQPFELFLLLLELHLDLMVQGSSFFALFAVVFLLWRRLEVIVLEVLYFCNELTVDATLGVSGERTGMLDDI